MILELELAALVALNAIALYRGRKPKPVSVTQAGLAPAHFTQNLTAAAAPAAAQSEPVEIVKRVGDLWFTVGHRHAAHPDVEEALRTPGLAVRRATGAIEEGKQQ